MEMKNTRVCRLRMINLIRS